MDIHIDYINTGESLLEVEPNRPLIDSYLKAFAEIEREYNIRNDITMNSLLNISDMFLVSQESEDEEFIRSLIHDAMDEAIFFNMVHRRGEIKKGHIKAG